MTLQCICYCYYKGFQDSSVFFFISWIKVQRSHFLDLVLSLSAKSTTLRDIIKKGTTTV